MSITRWFGALAMIGGAACGGKPDTNGTSTTKTPLAVAAPCTVTDSVSGSTVPCFMTAYDSVSGSTARAATNVSAVIREGGRTIPLSALAAACRDVSTGAVVSCSLGVMLGSTRTTTMQSAESVSGTPGRDSTK